MHKTKIWLSAAAALAALVVLGCGGKMRAVLPPDHAPSVKLGVARVPGMPPDSVAFDVHWSAVISGASVDHFEWALDPAGPATQWQRTTDTRRTFAFRVPTARVSPGRASEAISHLLLVRAMDSRGRFSEPVPAELPLANIPPTVQILSPAPSALIYQIVGPSVLVTWTGNDPDGVFTQKPVKYKYKLFKDTDAIFGVPPIGTDQFDLARANPDSLRRFYAPAFAQWDSVGGDTTSVQYLNLIPNSRYLFVLVGFDEAGDSNPVFSLNTNMLQMSVSFAGLNGPILTMLNQYFNYTYASGLYLDDPSRYVDVQVPGGVPLEFRWSGRPSVGALIQCYRWAVDIADLSDNTPRVNEATDLSHWSQCSLQATSARIGPYRGLGGGREVHRLYIEARDSNGLVSLGIVRFIVVPSGFADESSLLIVDDTRLLPDQAVIPPDPAHPDSVRPPAGNWPTAAELDTFLLARGGVRWRSTPDGTLSPPGIFAGYRFDTLSTRFLPGGSLPLYLLDPYRQIIWITGAAGTPGSLLASMSQPGHSNPLAAWVQQGGKLWLVGNCGYASTEAWNIALNDVPARGTIVFSSTPTGGRPPELTFGRFMYDLPHWQSTFAVTPDHVTITRSPRAVGGWAGAPDYGALPISIRPKTLANDPVPPWRTAAGFFTSTSVMSVEYLTAPNEISESSGSVLDTLFDASGAQLLAQGSPCMTLYHGSENGQVIVSGFDLWSSTRPDLIQLADFVLQQAWGLGREPIARLPYTGPVAGRGHSQ